MEHIFSNKRIPAKRRILPPVISGIVSFFLPGAAQAINGQVLKGVLLMLFWLGFTNLAVLKESSYYNAVKAIQYMCMFIISSDAYFIAGRMKFGEEVKAWSIFMCGMDTRR